MRDIGLYILGSIGLIGCLMCLYRAILSGDIFLALFDIVAIGVLCILLEFAVSRGI